MTPTLTFKHIFKGPSRYAPMQAMAIELTWRERDNASWQSFLQKLDDLVALLRPANVELLEQSLPPMAVVAERTTPALAHAHLAITLQRWAGHPVTQFGTCDDAEESSLAGYFEYALETTGAAAARFALGLMTFADGPVSSDRKMARNAFAKFSKNHLTQQNRAGYIRLAKERNIPWRAVASGDQTLAFGQGVKAIRVALNFSDNTSFIATSLSTNKYEAAATLRAHGIPVPTQYLVTDLHGALEAAKRIGFPVVIKPLTTDHGTAVTTGIASEADVRLAYRLAEPHGHVLVESQLPGNHHRITVIHGRMASARRQTPAHVIGDGKSSIRELVDAANKKRAADNTWLIDLNEESENLLARTGHDLTYVPAAGEAVTLHSHSNLVAGGTMEVVTDTVHPDNRKLAERAASIMGIEVAGLDFLTPDISQSYLDVGGGFCEVNVTPAFIFGEHQLLFDDWFPEPTNGRIPVIGIVNSAASNFAPALATNISKHFPQFSWASRSGLFIDGFCVDRSPQDNVQGAWRACAEPSSQAALLELDATNVWHNGLGVSQIDLLILPQEMKNETDPLISAGLALIEKASGKTCHAKSDASAARHLSTWLKENT